MRQHTEQPMLHKARYVNEARCPKGALNFQSFDIAYFSNKTRLACMITGLIRGEWLGGGTTSGKAKRRKYLSEPIGI